MKNEQILDALYDLRNLFNDYQELFSESVDQITPEYPIKNKDSLSLLEDRIARLLTKLTPTILKYSSAKKIKYLYGDSPDVYTESIRHTEFEIKVSYINKCIEDLNLIIEQIEAGSIRLSKLSEWPRSARIQNSKFIFDDKNWIEFQNTTSGRYKIFKELFDAKGNWVSIIKIKDSGVGDAKRTINHIESKLKKQNKHASYISIKREIVEGNLQVKIAYSPEKILGKS